MNFLLNTTAGNDNTMWIILAIGAILAICFYLYKSKTAGASKSNAIENEISTINDVSPANDNNDEEIIAVIAAAIAMAESESNGLKFKVVSFRRI